MDIKKMPLIGLRTIKTIIAVTITALCMKYIFKETPFFACIGAVVAVEQTISTSIKAAIIRNVGTLVGGIIGIFTTLLTDNVFLIPLGLIPLIYINKFIGKKEAIVPGSIVYFAVVYLNESSSNALEYGIHRILGTLFGTVIGFAVNYLIFKPKSQNVLQTSNDIDVLENTDVFENTELNNKKIYK